MSLSFGLPVIGSPSPKAESIKSSFKKCSVKLKKLNALSVNAQIDGIRVSSINNLEANRRLVTWKDTVKKCGRTAEECPSRSDGNISAICTPKKVPFAVCHDKPVIDLNTSDCVITFEPPERTLKETAKNPKRPRPKLSKEKTFSLETPSLQPSQKIAVENLGCESYSETHCNALTPHNPSKISIEKILSSNDVLHKIRMSKIPTKQSFKNLSDVLKKFKKSPDKRSTGEAHKSLQVINGSFVDSKIDHEGNVNETGCENETNEVRQIFEQTEETKICLEGAHQFLDLDEKLKGVDELSRLSEDEEKSHGLNRVCEQVDMNEWFVKEFSDVCSQKEDGREIDGDETQCQEHTAVVASSEKDSLEDPSHQKDELDEDLRSLELIKADVGLLAKEFEENNDELKAGENADKSAKLVYLYQSGTDLDLTRDNSQNTLTDKKSWSSVSTNFERELNQISEETFLQESNSSHFNLKKSFSDVNLINNNNKSYSLKYDESFSLVPLFTRRKFVFETDSVDFRKTCQDIRSISSVPAVHFADFRVKSERVEDQDKTNDGMNVSSERVDWENVGSKERLEILRIAAEKFIEETRSKSHGGGALSSGCVQEEDYTVPKKKRRVYFSDESDIALTDEIKVGREEEGVDKTGGGTSASIDGEPVDGNIQIQPHSAASSTALSDVTPRTLSLMEKIAKGRQLQSENRDVLIAVTVSECERLLEIDSKCLRRIEARLKKGRHGEGLKLPLIVGGGMIGRENRRSQEVQVGCGGSGDVLKLPVIVQSRANKNSGVKTGFNQR